MAHLTSRFTFGRRAALLYSVAALLLLSVSAQATPVIDTIPIYDTGIPAGPYSIQDKYWVYGVTNDPTISPGVFQSAYILDVNAWPIHNGPYYKPVNGSRWIGPEPQYSGGYLTAQQGVYFVYQTSFYIPDKVNPATMLIWGGLAADNCAVTISLNGSKVEDGGRQIMAPGTCLGQDHLFKLGGADANFGSTSGLYFATGAFKNGMNTITFTVYNTPGTEPNPSSLIVWMDAIGLETPEASTVGLVIGGLGLFGWLRRRRSQA